MKDKPEVNFGGGRRIVFQVLIDARGRRRHDLKVYGAHGALRPFQAIALLDAALRECEADLVAEAVDALNAAESQREAA